MGTNPLRAWWRIISATSMALHCGAEASNYGIVYKVDSTGKETGLHTFTGPPDGAYPYAGVVIDAAGGLYGATAYGGAGSCVVGPGCGTVFKVNTTGAETVLYSIMGGADSAYPTGVVLDAAGNIYGTTSRGYTGTGYGTVFKLDTTNQLIVLYTFTGGTDGSIPASPLFRDGVGALFGTTEHGGVSNAGTVFEVEPDDRFSTLYSFTGGKDGASPAGRVLEGAKGDCQRWHFRCLWRAGLRSRVRDSPLVAA
jgi:uncharacterized repeat protein (TIGR03803 family)